MSVNIGYRINCCRTWYKHSCSNQDVLSQLNQSPSLYSVLSSGQHVMLSNTLWPNYPQTWSQMSGCHVLTLHFKGFPPCWDGLFVPRLDSRPCNKTSVSFLTSHCDRLKRSHKHTPSVFSVFHLSSSIVHTALNINKQNETCTMRPGH